MKRGSYTQGYAYCMTLWQQGWTTIELMDEHISLMESGLYTDSYVNGFNDAIQKCSQLS